MNILFMQNGLPRNGLVALYDPYRDTYGRNILPVGSEDFVTDWAAIAGETITVTDYPTTININGVDTAVIAKRIQGTGNGGVKEKYGSSIINGLSNPHQSIIAVYAKNLTAVTVKVYDYFASSVNAVSIGTDFTKITISQSITATQSKLNFFTNSVTDALDIVVYQPQVNLGTLYPYSPPAGLPQSLTDYTGRGNNAQLGSTAGADTNDPAYSGQGLTFGIDDYCKSSASVFDDMQAFTCITVCKANSAGGNSAGRLFEKFDNAGVKGIRCYISSNTLKLARYDGSTNYKVWANQQTMSYGSNAIFALSAIQSGDDNAVKSWVTVTKQTPTVTVAGTPTVVTDASYDLYIGNRSNADCNFDGTIYCQLWYNRILSDTEYMQAHSYLKRLMNSRGITI